MLRWEARALSTASGSVSRNSSGEFEISTLEATDFAYAYFFWAHSLRDWLINSGSIDKSKLDAILSNRNEWKMVRDIANKNKHKEITRNPTDPNWSSVMKIDLNSLLRGQSGVESYILFDGQCIDFTECIRSIGGMWSGVLIELELIETPK
jgi:hypothetical protein